MHYQFIKTNWYYCSVADGGGVPCANCGALITTVVTLQRDDQKSFQVGSDCAKTLQGISKDEIKTIEKKVSQNLSRLKDIERMSNVVFTPNGDKIDVLTYTTKGFTGEPYLSINYKFSLDKEFFKGAETTKEDLEAIDPKLLATFGFRYYFLKENVFG